MGGGFYRGGYSASPILHRPPVHQQPPHDPVPVHRFLDLGGVDAGLDSTALFDRL